MPTAEGANKADHSCVREPVPVTDWPPVDSRRVAVDVGSVRVHEYPVIGDAATTQFVPQSSTHDDHQVGRREQGLLDKPGEAAVARRTSPVLADPDLRAVVLQTSGTPSRRASFSPAVLPKQYRW